MIKFGNSTLIAGNGNGDLLVGDTPIFSFSLTAGISTGVGTANSSAVAINNIIYLGSNTLTAGNGNHVELDGSMQLTSGAMSSLQALDSFVLAGNTVIGGHDVLTVGNGNHNVLFGGFGTGVTLLFASQSVVAGVGVAGTNIMTGGNAADTFQVDLAHGPLNSGANTLMNFAPNDILQLHDVLNVTVANNESRVIVSTAAMDGTGGHPVLIFDQHSGNGTSIDFVNMTYDSVHDTDLSHFALNHGVHLLIA